jgi:hypothetical protein
MLSTITVNSRLAGNGYKEVGERGKTDRSHRSRKSSRPFLPFLSSLCPVLSPAGMRIAENKNAYIVKNKKIMVSMHPNHCENCRHALRNARSFTVSTCLCKAGGMVREPDLPHWWIYIFGCPLSECAALTGVRKNLICRNNYLSGENFSLRRSRCRYCQSRSPAIAASAFRGFADLKTACKAYFAAPRACVFTCAVATA